MKKFEKFKKVKIRLAKKAKEIFTKKEAEEIYNEALRRIEWEKGEMWLEARSDEEIKQEIISKSKEVAETYFKRQAWEKMVDKITELLTGLDLKSRRATKGKIDKFRKPKIVMVEDDPFLCDIYQNKFEEAGFKIKIFNDAVKIVENVIKEKPDIISMGIILAGNINGYEATKKLKEDLRTKDIPIIGLDNLSQKEDIEKAKNIGMEDYFIASEFTPSQYIEFIKNFIRKQSKN